ncbi:hypothetical protein HanIR_Chr01g0017751 [Helianthus annuus]|uniref:Uncharacterized protein n=1 Tax=Helianthus annuus TaxID=4232 RepID=A0A251VNP4_HELAN|nr:hypothetical protein HanIR_Chr01g0017751 [Helianthus annuus]
MVTFAELLEAKKSHETKAKPLRLLSKSQGNPHKPQRVHPMGFFFSHSPMDLAEAKDSAPLGEGGVVLGVLPHTVQSFEKILRITFTG